MSCELARTALGPSDLWLSLAAPSGSARRLPRQSRLPAKEAPRRAAGVTGCQGCTRDINEQVYDLTTSRINAKFVRCHPRTANGIIAADTTLDIRWQLVGSRLTYGLHSYQR